MSLYKQADISWEGVVAYTQAPKMAPVRRRPRRVQRKIDKRLGMLHYGQRHTFASGLNYLAYTRSLAAW